MRRRPTHGYARRRRRVGSEDRISGKLRLIALSVCLVPLLLVVGIFWKGGFHGAVLALGTPAYALAREASAVDTVVVIEAATDLRITAVPADTQETTVEAMTISKAPRVLIYHTHATEAYLQYGDDTYEASGSWRTKDESKNIVAVGKLLTELLNEEYGIAAIHDTTNHEPPKLSTSYSRSLLTMQAYQERYPTIEYFIDVHRDAYGKKTVDEPQDYVEIDGAQVARLMFVVGTGAGATGAGFADMPDFASNRAFAQDITARLQRAHAGLTRDVRVKTGRYNQHVSPHCLLVEVGHNANTLSQALAAVPYLAQAIAQSIEAYEQSVQVDVAITAWVPKG